ncbi:MAG: hypothetical protein Q4C25_04760 [Bacillota bacterium]|nr:hypothetical protein [Bacillota bacterium]
MKKMIIGMLLIFLLFFGGASCILYLDNLCFETTGQGGNLVFNVAN